MRIRYRRPPHDEEVFVQRMVLDRGDMQVMLSEPMRLDAAREIDGEIVLESGSRVVWFTFPGLWHDIGRFHRADGHFTGLYANIIRPIEVRASGEWLMTDLCLDVWIGARGGVKVLDEEDLAASRSAGHMSEADAQRARVEVDRILEDAERGIWPPAVVHEWTLERALAQD